MSPKVLHLLVLAAVVSLFCVACGDEDNDPKEVSMPVAVCDMTPHQWLPASQVGAVVNYERQGLYSLNKDAIESILDSTEYSGAVEVQYGVEVYQYRYVTQDRGQTTEATGVFAFPQIEAGKTRNADTVLWLHGTTGFMDDCSPSNPDQGDGYTAGMLLASQGYVVVAPDYIGLNGDDIPSELFHSYLVGEPTAIASWDAMRAADKALPEVTDTVTTSGKVVIWGGSQGGHATLFTELYWPHYAPEYDVVAAVPLIPPSNLVGQAEAAMSSFSGATVLLTAAFISHSRWYGFEEQLADILTDTEPNKLASTLPGLMDTTCDVDDDLFEVDSVDDVYLPDFTDAMLNRDWEGFEQWKCTMAENSLHTTSVPRISDTPMLYVLSQEDELVELTVEQPAFDRLCDMGYNMNYIECLGAGHSQGALWSLPEQFAWVADRLAGKPLENACERGPAQCCSLSDSDTCTP